MTVLVVGNSGSGKSTLARQLAAQHGLVHIDLDRFAWAGEVGVRRDVEDAAAAVHTEVSGRSAVIEGCYADLVQTLITPDDRLIWLDLPVDQCVAHCRARPFEPHKWESADAQDAFLPQLLEWVGAYPSRVGPLGRAAHRALFQGFEGEKECRTARTPVT